MEPAKVATELAARLIPLDWVESAGVSGNGYLTVTVTADTLARLAVRITQAGPACARSRTLAAITLTAPRDPYLDAAPDWEKAHRHLVAVTTGRLAGAAGADVAWLHEDDAGRERRPDGGPVAGAIAFAGRDAITFALARLAPGTTVRVEPRAAAAHRLANPAYAVRYAHARAASTLRQAADLGLGLGDAAGFRPRLLAQTGELSLLCELSWLPERVAGAARRGQPGVLARHLERLAGAYLGCQERHPAVWPGMPRGGIPATVPRLWLTAAAATALAAGLGLLGVAAPDRL